MSMETLVVGYIEFKAGVSEEEINKIIKDLEDVFECNIKYNAQFDCYEFEDINWSSHVDWEEVEQIFELYKDKFKYADAHLYDLNSPNESISIDNIEE